MRNYRLFPFLFFLPVLASCSSKQGSNEVKDSAPKLPQLSSVRSVGHLTLAEMSVRKVGTIDDLSVSESKNLRQSALAVLNKFKIGERKGAWSYDTYLRASIDLSALTRADMSVDSVSRTVRLQLPPVRVETAGRDAAMREEHYRVTGLRSQISPDERAALKEEMNSMLRREVENDPQFRKTLENRARARAVAYFDSLFAMSGYHTEIYFK